MKKVDMSKEYSEEFDRLRKNRVETSYYKYGPHEEKLCNGKCTGDSNHETVH